VIRAFLPASPANIDTTPQHCPTNRTALVLITMTTSSLSREDLTNIYTPNIVIAALSDFNSKKRNQTASPFLRLPAELRNKIYHYIFDSTYIRVLRMTSRHFAVNDNLSFMMTSCQVHHETGNLSTTLLLKFGIPKDTMTAMLDVGARAKICTIMLSPGSCYVWNTLQQGRIRKDFRGAFPSLERIVLSERETAFRISSTAHWEREWPERVRRIFDKEDLVVDFDYKS